MSAVSSTTVRRRLSCRLGNRGRHWPFSCLLPMGWIPAIASADAQDAVKMSPAKGSGGPAFLPLANEPAAKIIIDPPLAEALARGVVIIQYRTENLRILPVFGPDAVKISPRVGHLHVTLDDAPWHWAHTTGEPLIVAGLPGGSHKLLIELADANHKVLDKGIVDFVVPK